MQQDSAIICGSRRSRRWIGLGIGDTYVLKSRLPVGSVTLTCKTRYETAIPVRYYNTDLLLFCTFHFPLFPIKTPRALHGPLPVGLGHGDFGEAAVRELQGSLTARWLIATVSNHGGCRAGSNSKTLARPPRLLSWMATLSLCSLGLFCVDRPAGLTDANAMRACCFACGRRIPLPVRWPITGVVWYYYLILLLADAILSIDTIIMHLTTPIHVICYGPMDKCCL